MKQVKNFHIGTEIFEDVSDLIEKMREAYRNESTDSEEFENMENALYSSVATTMEKSSDESSEEFEDRLIEEMSYTIHFYKVSKYGILYGALMAWFRYRGESMNEKIRGFYEDDGNIYFITGTGYDTISSDLLGGEADGELKAEFLEFLNN